MNMQRKTAKGSDGRIIRVGDKVQCISIYSPGELLSIVEVKKITAQGYNGTILHCYPAPDLEFPHHFSHRANKAYKIEK